LIDRPYSQGIVYNLYPSRTVAGYAGSPQRIECETSSSVLLQAIDEGLLVLGERVRYAIYYHIESKSHLRRQEIPFRVQAFHEALQDIFGAGSEVIEKLIARSLYRKIGLSFKAHRNWTLVDYIEDAKTARLGLVE
jgi:hypothetical protein